MNKVKNIKYKLVWYIDFVIDDQRWHTIRYEYSRMAQIVIVSRKNVF